MLSFQSGDALWQCHQEVRGVFPCGSVLETLPARHTGTHCQRFHFVPQHVGNLFLKYSLLWFCMHVTLRVDFVFLFKTQSRRPRMQQGMLLLLVWSNGKKSPLTYMQHTSKMLAIDLIRLWCTTPVWTFCHNDNMYHTSAFLIDPPPLMPFMPNRTHFIQTRWIAVINPKFKFPPVLRKNALAYKS